MQLAVTWCFDNNVYTALSEGGVIADGDHYSYEDFVREIGLPDVVEIDPAVWGAVKSAQDMVTLLEQLSARYGTLPDRYGYTVLSVEPR